LAVQRGEAVAAFEVFLDQLLHHEMRLHGGAR